MQPIKLFYSYSHVDEALRNSLNNHLSSLRRSKHITEWHDRMITAGTEWKNAIDDNLITSQVILLLISSDFLASNYCQDIEVKKALEMHESGQAVVIPIILRECDWKHDGFAKLQGLPTDGKAVTSGVWNSQDAAFTIVVQGIRDVIENLNRIDVEKVDNQQNIIENSNCDDDDIVSAVRLALDKQKELTFTSTEEDIHMLRDLKNKIQLHFDTIQNKIDSIPDLADSYISSLFDTIYTTEILEKSTREEILNVRTNEKYSWHHRSVVVSALTVSLLNFKKVDQNKILLLLDFISDKEGKVWENALTGLSIALTVRKNAWVRFNMVTSKLKGLRNDLDIQKGLSSIAYVLEHQLYDVYLLSENSVNIDFFKRKPANWFLPFYENNEGIKHLLENTSIDQIDDFLINLENSPIPDAIKYIVCYSEDNISRDLTKNETLYLRYMINVSRRFNPFLQYITQLHSFFNFFPLEIQEKIFFKELSLASVQLKDYVFTEAEKHWVQGMHFMRQKEIGFAINSFRNSLKYRPDDLRVLTNLASCYNGNYQYSEALSQRKKIEELDADNIDNIVATSELYNKIGEQKIALEYCNKLSNKNHNEKWFTLKANLLKDTGDYLESLNLCDKGLEQYPNNATLCEIKARILNELNLFEEALMFYNKAVEIDEHNVGLLSRRANFYVTYSMLEDAFSDYRKIIEITEDNYVAHLGLAWCYGLENNFEKSQNHFEEAIKISPKSPDVYVSRANFFLVNEAYSSALFHVDRALLINKNNPTALLIRMKVYSKMERIQEAIADISHLIKLYPKKGEYRLRYAALLAQSNCEDSIIEKEVQTAFENSINDAADLLLYVEVLLKQQLFNNAIEKIDMLINKFPNNADYYFTKAYINDQSKSYSDALWNINYAINLNQYKSNYYVLKAAILKNLDKPNEAIECLKSSLLQNELNVDAHINLANYLNLSGKIDEALNVISNIGRFNGTLKTESNFYYGVLAEIYANKGNKEQFLKNLEIALQHKLKIESIDSTIKEKYKHDIEYHQVMKHHGIVDELS